MNVDFAPFRLFVKVSLKNSVNQDQILQVVQSDIDLLPVDKALNPGLVAEE